MAKWKVSFSRICEQDIDVDAESEAGALLEALKKWQTQNPDVPHINYICNIDEQWGRPLK